MRILKIIPRRIHYMSEASPEGVGSDAPLVTDNPQRLCRGSQKQDMLTCKVSRYCLLSLYAALMYVYIHRNTSQPLVPKHPRPTSLTCYILTFSIAASVQY